MKSAVLQEMLADRRVRCGVCPHACIIRTGRRGVCGVRENRDGTLYALNYGRVVALHVDPIEKKPLYHFLPGTRSLSIATVGCNLRCANCQNFKISQWPQEHPVADIPGDEIPSDKIASDAVESGCASVSYTYTEPTIFCEYAIDVMKECRARGVKNVFVTNGFMSKPLIELLSVDLDAANIDLKSSSDDFYKKNCGARVEPVKEAITSLWEAGVWVEVTTLLIPGLNDTTEDMEGVASFIAAVSTDIPWHVSAFHPDFRLTKVPSTSVKKIGEAIAIGRKAGIKHIYGGNVDVQNDTACPCCDEILVGRVGYSIVKNGITDGKCPSCGALIAGRW